MLCYFAVQIAEPHGAFEFAYFPFLPALHPYGAMCGFTYEQLWGHVRRICLLGPGLVLFLWGLQHYVRLPAPRDWTRLTQLAVALCLLVIAGLMLGLLRGRAVIDDEMAYAMQASFFGSGHIAGPDLGVNPNDVGTVAARIGYSIKYLPGESLTQVVGVKLGVPALAHLPVVFVTLWAWHRALSLSSGPAIARYATIALSCSPMLIFTSATGLSHATSLMWTVLLGLAFEWIGSGKPMRGAALAGVALAFGMLTRPQSMLPVGAVFGPCLVVRLWQRRAYASMAVLALTAGAGLGAVLAYNRVITGSPLKLPWFLQCGAEHYGFGRVWVVNLFEHTPALALKNLAVVAMRLNSWLLGWPWSLAVFPAWLALGRRTTGAPVWLWAGLAVLVFEFFYYSPGVSDTGAIYHYELLLPFALICGVVAQTVLERWPDFAPLWLCCGMILGTGSWILEQGLRLQRLVTTIHRDSDQALARIAAPAVLIYERWPGEAIARGWVFDAFPLRFRTGDAKVVTVPRLGPDTPAVAARVYPGRSCWYFHYLPGTPRPELLECAAAARWLERPAVPDPKDFVRPYIETSTAYRVTDYSPFSYITSLAIRDSTGLPELLCCHKRGLARLGHAPKALRERACVETGEP